MCRCAAIMEQRYTHFERQFPTRKVNQRCTNFWHPAVENSDLKIKTDGLAFSALTQERPIKELRDPFPVHVLEEVKHGRLFGLLIRQQRHAILRTDSQLSNTLQESLHRTEFEQKLLSSAAERFAIDTRKKVRAPAASGESLFPFVGTERIAVQGRRSRQGSAQREARPLRRQFGAKLLSRALPVRRRRQPSHYI